MNNGIVLGIFTFGILIISTISQIVAFKAGQKDIYLGIRIPYEEIENSKLKYIGKSYVLFNIIFGIPLAILISYYVYITDNSIAYLVAIFAFIFFDFLIYYYHNRKVYKLKKKEGWLKTKKQEIIIDTSFNKQKKEKMIAGNKWFAISLVFVIICLAVNIIQYPNIPHRYPSHWNISGNITGYSIKTYFAIFSTPINQLILILITFFIYKITFWSKNEINTNVSIENNIKFRNVWGIYIIILNFVMQIVLLIDDFQTIQLIKENISLINIIIIVITMIVTLVSLVIGFKVGQGGSKLKANEGKREIAINMRDDDKYWKMGNLIYYNTNDPSIFVQKRFGIGWTVNVGSRGGQIFYAIIIIFIIVSLLIGKK